GSRSPRSRSGRGSAGTCSPRTGSLASKSATAKFVHVERPASNRFGLGIGIELEHRAEVLVRRRVLSLPQVPPRRLEPPARAVTAGGHRATPNGNARAALRILGAPVERVAE